MKNRILWHVYGTECWKSNHDESLKGITVFYRSEPSQKLRVFSRRLRFWGLLPCVHLGDLAHLRWAQRCLEASPPVDRTAERLCKTWCWEFCKAEQTIRIIRRAAHPPLLFIVFRHFDQTPHHTVSWWIKCQLYILSWTLYIYIILECGFAIFDISLIYLIKCTKPFTGIVKDRSLTSPRYSDWNPFAKILRDWPLQLWKHGSSKECAAMCSVHLSTPHQLCLGHLKTRATQCSKMCHCCLVEGHCQCVCGLLRQLSSPQLARTVMACGAEMQKKPIKGLETQKPWIEYVLDVLWFISLQIIFTIFRQVKSNIAIREAVCTVSTGTDNR